MKGFLDWLQAHENKLYNAIQGKIPGNLAGLGLTAPDATNASTATEAPASSTWNDTIKNLLNTAAQGYLAKSQVDTIKQINDLQLQRARNGQSPLNINPSDYGISPTVNFGISSNTQKLLMIGGGLALAVYLLSQVVGKHHAH